MWKLWAKALGQKASDVDAEADAVALIRTVLVIFNIIVGIITLVTSGFIVAGVIRHW